MTSNACLPIKLSFKTQHGKNFERSYLIRQRYKEYRAASEFTNIWTEQVCFPYGREVVVTASHAS